MNLSTKDVLDDDLDVPAYEMDISTKASRARAAKENLDVVVAGKGDLFLDIDTLDQLKTFEEMLPKVQKKIKVKQYKSTRSKSGNHHIYLRCKTPLSVIERIALQAILGSDPKKELCSLLNVRRGELEPILFFETRPPKPHINEPY